MWGWYDNVWICWTPRINAQCWIKILGFSFNIWQSGNIQPDCTCYWARIKFTDSIFRLWFRVSRIWILPSSTEKHVQIKGKPIHPKNITGQIHMYVSFPLHILNQWWNCYFRINITWLLQTLASISRMPSILGMYNVRRGKVYNPGWNGQLQGIRCLDKYRGQPALSHGVNIAHMSL